MWLSNILAIAFVASFGASIAGCGGSDVGTPSTAPSPSSSGAPSSTPPTPESSGSTSEPTPAPLGAPYPMVFLHGMAGFGKLQVGPIGVTYFNGVVDDLAKRGEQVFITLAPPFDTSEARAAAIAEQIDVILTQTGKAKVNLVGHSQGGMDARLLASPAGLGYGDRIASITTVSTPHRGSKVADLVLGMISGIPSSVVDDVTGAVLSLAEKTAYELKTDPHLRAQLEELSVDHMTNVFNPKYVDDPRVTYTSYAGRTNLRTGIGVCDNGKYSNDPSSLDITQAALVPTAVFLEDGLHFIVNDGLVTVDSAKWGTFLQCVPADHLKEVGLLGPVADSFDHLAFYRSVVARVRDAGF